MRLALSLLLAALAAPLQAQAPQPSVRLLVQSSPLAGYRHALAAAVWPLLAPGDALELTREPDNPHDGNAVRVAWRGRKLGYVPRAENAALAWAMDRGESVRARISRLQQHRNGRRRLEFEVTIE
jgi:hypothetical protein